MLKAFLPKQWAIMSFYQRFESLIALALTLIVMFVVPCHGVPGGMDLLEHSIRLVEQAGQ